MDFQKVMDDAVAAGKAAAAALVPVPMVVVGGGQKYFVPDGVCGFAWVKVTPATQPFAKWLKKTGKVQGAAYGGGYDLWVSDYSQSMQLKEAYAYAFADVLKAAGVTAYAQSRMD